MYINPYYDARDKVMPLLQKMPDNAVHASVKYYTKIFPNYVKIVKYETPRVQKISGFEPRIKKAITAKSTLDAPEDNLERSLSRTKTLISDLIISNEFTHFATFTFNCRNCPIMGGRRCKNFSKDPKTGKHYHCICTPDKCLRNDPASQKHRMSLWLKRERKKYPEMAYLIVPEFHKDGKALHFHALIKGYGGKLVDSGHNINGRKSFMIYSYTLGFNSLVSIDHNVEKVGNYVKKYITKDMPVFPGQKRFWTSTNLLRPLCFPTFEGQLHPLVDNPFIEVIETYRFMGIVLLRADVRMHLQQQFKWEKLPWQKPTLTLTSNRELTQVSLSPYLEKHGLKDAKVKRANIIDLKSRLTKTGTRSYSLN